MGLDGLTPVLAMARSFARPGRAAVLTADEWLQISRKCDAYDVWFELHRSRIEQAFRLEMEKVST